MLKNILSVSIFLLSISFFYFVRHEYLSHNYDSKIKKNMETIVQKINSNTNGLPFLANDTNDVIIFNSGFENKNQKIERNFWKLFKKND
tara:strand:- start:1 stop:267 length:267 start_codon:yes stop_codon:yes gene_type:complete